ncbi:hypothetical protein [Herbaspirillum sp. ST 5-3]|uniref:hypothetical protein n=1 Tax=Oxalobacteraceae TaxID=75682 RepID=UPI0010A58918|nr:hypothetical protein [Herbaspirillum sp. ST 5-3]
MPQERPHRNRPRRPSVALEEEKAWIAFYRRMGEPSIAAELIQHLEADPDLKRAHPALYLRCKQTLRRNKERQARAQRIGQFVRLFLRVVVANPLWALRRALHAGRDIAVECLPETDGEPAARRVKRLSGKSEFASERKGFASQSGATGTALPAQANGDGKSQESKTA